MIDRDIFLEIQEKYGHYASWAVWAEEGERPKSNVGDLSIFNLEKNPQIIEILNPNVIMVGLNISRPIEFKLGNFHDKRPHSQDYKIRYAFKKSDFWGAYMTDIIKDFEGVVSGKLVSYINENRNFELDNIEIFRRELDDIGSVNPLIIAFGNHSYNILSRHLNNEFKIIKIPHYSMHISKENYKEQVNKILSEI